MGITCPSCGKANISPSTLSCPVCHKILPATMSIVSGSGLAPKSVSPALIDTRGRRYKIMNSTSSTKIGSRGCGILLGDSGVPPQAAQLNPHGGGFLLDDLCGSVKVNGTAMSIPWALTPGDKITIGPVTLIYQGPATTHVSVVSPPPPPLSPPVTPPVIISSPPPSLSPPVTPLVVIPSPPPPPPMALSLPPGLSLKGWGANPPLAEGYVELVDGPHRVEKGNMGARLAASLALTAISTSLAMIPFWMKQDVNVWFLRVKDYKTGKMMSVVMRGEPGSLPQLGDFIAVWGLYKDGNIVMQHGYSYTTDSVIKLKG
jgi:hypothetical protein